MLIYTRDNKITTELDRTVDQIIKGITITYTEVYYLDYDVDENTGVINKQKKSMFYTKDQVNRNITEMRKAYDSIKL